MESPVFFQAIKHHMSYMIDTIKTLSKRGEEGEKEFLRELLVLGERGTADVYEGERRVEEISGDVEHFLRQEGLLDQASYLKYLESEGAEKRMGLYTVHTLSDESQFVFRYIDDGAKYVHIHPARYSPRTFRIKVNTLKSALFSCFLSLAKDAPLGYEVVEEARAKLCLSPMPEVPSALQGMMDKLGQFHRERKED